MSFVITLFIAAVVFFYVRGTRMARNKWLARLNLPGRWRIEGETPLFTINGEPINNPLPRFDEGSVDSSDESSDESSKDASQESVSADEVNPGRTNKRRDIVLELSGNLSGGRFSQTYVDEEVAGSWRQSGSRLSLVTEATTTTYEVHFFDNGRVGLEDQAGRRILLEKLSNAKGTQKPAWT